MIEEALPWTLRSDNAPRAVLAKVEIMIDEMMIRPTVDVGQLAQVIRAVRAI